MQNDICIIGVKLNARNVFLSHKFTCKDTCATHQLRHRWRFAWNDARHRSTAASVHRHQELDRPTAAFLPYFCSQSGSDLCWWVAKCPVKWTQVSRFRRLIVPGARWAGTLNCWKIKNSPQISCMTCSSFWIRSTSWQYASLSIDKNQVYSRPTSTHPWTPLSTWWRSSVSARDALVQPVSFSSQPAHRCTFLKILGMAA